MRRALLILFMTAFCGTLRAHQVPQVIIEAEFGAKREIVIRANIDPRLFLSAEPTTLPPVPASWWFEQDDAAKEKTKRSAADYIEQTFKVQLGSETLKGDWKVQPIDSASAFPLGEASTETHFLVEHQGVLPESAETFKLLIAKQCPVPVILLSRNIGEAEARPEALFGGESSKSFPLPELPKPPPAAPTPPSTPVLAHVKGFLSQAHLVWDHLALAALLGLARHRRWWQAVGLLAGFHAMDLLASSLTLAGWLPAAPMWMIVAYWIALALTALHLLVLKSGNSILFLTLAAAGLCHGLNAPHLRLDAATGGSLTPLLSQSGTLLLLELTVLFATATLVSLVRRRAATNSGATTA